MHVWPGSARTRWGSFSVPPDSLASIGGGVLLLRGREGGGKGVGGEQIGKGRGDREGRRDMERRVRGRACLLFI